MYERKNYHNYSNNKTEPEIHETITNRVMISINVNNNYTH
jgi:hypothetical protein